MDQFIQKGPVRPSASDHRKLGRQLELFSFHEEGPGFPFFLPKGLALMNQLVAHWREEHQKEGYQEIQSPMLLDRKLWEKSGHWDLYQENMYVSEVEKRVFAIKPMNCPGAILHFKERKRNFSELPFRICEMGRVHRDENSGSLNGLLRARSFVVDDAHIFCSKEQILSEIRNILSLSQRILKHCGLYDFHIELSVRSEGKAHKYLGEDENWEFAESVLEQAIIDSELPFHRKEGEAKFYGPAIDLKIKDSFGREWQCSSIQMDFNLPGRFDLHFFDSQGKRQPVFILHRCIYGSLERFMGILIEHHEGHFPLWMAPVQSCLLPISDRGRRHLEDLAEKMRGHNIRFEWDIKEEHISHKIKRAQRSKIPFMILAGDKEVEKGVYSVRKISGEKLHSVSVEEVFRLFSPE